MNGDYYLGAVLASCVTKLVLRLIELGAGAALENSYKAEAMLIMTSMIRIGQSDFVSIPLDEDSYDRMLSCLRVLGNLDRDVIDIFVKDCKAVYANMVQAEDVSVAFQSSSNTVLLRTR
jgi:coatomer subunit beta